MYTFFSVKEARIHKATSSDEEQSSGLFLCSEPGCQMVFKNSVTLRVILMLANTVKNAGAPKRCIWQTQKRVSMGLTVSRKAAKNLAVRRKNERILSVSRKKILTVKISNHKIRSRDLLLSQWCVMRSWVLVARITIETGSVESVCIICRMDVHCTSWQTFWQLHYFATFYFLSCWLVAMAALKAIVRGYLHETGTNSDRREFVSTSIHFFLCVYMRLAWQWNQTGLTSSRLLDRDEKFLYRSEFVPFSCRWQQISDRVQKFQAWLLFGQRYIYLTKHVILSRNQALSISSRFHENGCKNFIPVKLHTGLSSSRSHVHTP